MQTFLSARLGWIRGFGARVAKMRAIGWFGKFHYRCQTWRRDNSAKIEIAIWLMAVIGAVVILPELQRRLTPYLDEKWMANLQTWAVTIGGAMVGATAIASSFVLFAMQVNVTRLPYGLFYRFSSDFRLLSAFALSFVVATAGTALSLISAQNHAALLVVSEIAAAIAVLRLLLLAYRRSLHLVNPVQQLAIIYRTADHNLRRVEKHIRWALPHLQSEQEDGVDAARRAILDASPYWDDFLRTTIEHGIAFARRAGEQGDLEISEKALSVVVTLNARYVQVKGKTFFANNLIIDNPLVHDGTISFTLEALRRLYEVTLARRDEPQIEQIFRTYSALVQVYLGIEYGTGQSKSHALLATGYLERAVEGVIQHRLIDTTMQGTRVLGGVGREFFMARNPTEGVGCVSKISIIGMVGAASELHRPLTLVAMEEMRDLLFVLLRSETPDIGYAARELRKSAKEVAATFLQIPDTPVTSTHSTFLAPYYSSSSYTSLRSNLTNLVNALQNPENAEAAERVADHFEDWADGMFDDQKQLLLLSIEKRSHFTFDIIHWISGLTEILIGASRAPHTRDHTRRELENHALWLFSTLSWISTDQATVNFVENFSFRNEVFETGLKARNNNWPDGFDAVWKLSLNWAIEGGRSQSSWGTLGRWLAALCALALWQDTDRGDQLKAELGGRLSGTGAPSQELRDTAARDLREKAEDIREREFELDLVERILAANDRQQTQTLLREIADILSPGTAGERVRPRWFLGG